MSGPDEERLARTQRAGAAATVVLRHRIEGLLGPIPGRGDGLPRARVDESPLVVWSMTATDAERDALRQDSTLDSALRAAMRDSGYPALDSLPVVFMSQETTDRDAARWERTRRAAAAIKPILDRRVEALSEPLPEAVDGVSLPRAMVFESPLQVWVVTRTDAERDALKRDGSIGAEVRAAMGDSGFPAIEALAVIFESQETVDRDYDGQWRYAMK